MAVFNTFTNRLPDPYHLVNEAGSADPVNGVAGPGFSSVNFTSNGETQVSRTNSGRGVHRDQEVQYWSFSIRYNPMTREVFEPVDAFLASRNARKHPFFVVLPQYVKPRDATFTIWLLGGGIVNTVGTHLAGVDRLLINCSSATTGNPRPGDMFTITDVANANHLKVYKVTRVETPTTFQAGTTAPTGNQRRVHFSPPLQRTTSATSKLNFIEPMFRVVAKNDLREYDLNTENLYAFSLDVEEIQP